MMTQVKTADEIAAMRESGRMLATVLEKLRKSVEPGMSTKDLSEIAKEELRALGGQPPFLGFFGYPDVLCVSVNDEVVHGIPRPKHILADGDIVSMDFGVTYRGMVTDAAISVILGKGTSEAIKLVETTERSLKAGIKAVHGGCKTGDIGAAVEAVLAPAGYGIVRDLVGHGVGHSLHEDPNIPNYGKAGHGETLLSGMTIAIEPMATLGTHKVITDSDQWTIRTADGSLAAHFEHTVLITDNGAEILTTL
jgi:methionyl aminopeptidase